MIDNNYMKNSAKFKEIDKEVALSYQDWHRKVFETGVLDRKIKELMALAASCALRCEYCIESHAQKAKAFGATDEEIAKAIQIGALVNAGGTISYGVKALED
jgi:AhpD family alkylhydroperoxidase